MNELEKELLERAKFVISTAIECGKSPKEKKYYYIHEHAIKSLQDVVNKYEESK